MILQRLVELAERANLDPLWRYAPVDFAVDLGQGGEFLGMTRLGDGKRGLDMRVPVEPNRPGNVRPVFLVDNVRYTLGIPKPEPDGTVTAKNIEQANTYFDAFREKMRVQADATKEPDLLAVCRFLEHRAGQRKERDPLRDAHPWTGSERICFRVAGHFLHDNIACIASYQAMSAEEQAEGKLGMCLVSGARSPIARLHPMVKRVPTAQTAGASLVSYNADSFESQHLSQGENSPVSVSVAHKYPAALNFLLESTKERRFRQGISIGEDTVLLFWTRKECRFEDTFLALLDPREDSGAVASDEQVLRAVEAPLRGLAAADFDDEGFYALTLAGNAARVVVRDWLDTTAGNVRANLKRYFQDLKLGDDVGAPTPMWLLLKSVESPQAPLSSALATKLFRAAVNGDPFPRELLAHALRRIRLPPKDGEGPNTFRNRIAIVKAVLARLPDSQRKEVTVSLDETHTSIPYLLGRLFASLEKLQGDAIEKANATIRDKFFGAASATPATVFPRLLRLSMHHANKAEGKGIRAEKAKGAIISMLPAAGAFPRTMNLVDQGVFAVGYYHQREAFFRKSESSEPEGAQ
jgi:CRISPR-associated protein Csd1